MAAAHRGGVAAASAFCAVSQATKSSLPPSKRALPGHLATWCDPLVRTVLRSWRCHRPQPQPPTDRVAGELRARIAAGEWSPAERLPSVGELADAHNTSRAIMSKVLGRLADEGLLTVVQS